MTNAALLEALTSRTAQFVQDHVLAVDDAFDGDIESAGGDTCRISLQQAARGDGGWVINGEKRFITGADGAAFFIVMARTSRVPGQAGGATMFLVPADLPGVTVVRHMGMVDRSMIGGHCVVSFDQVAVPHDAVLGDVDEGFRVQGDFRIDNTLLTFDAAPAARVAAVVDWELSTIGDPVADVAMMGAYRHPAFDLIVGSPSAWTSSRLPEPTGLATLYESVAGITLIDLDLHLALAYFKIAVIAAGISHRTGSGARTGLDRAGDSVEPFLDAASSTLRGISA